ncbi:hypothetical protein GQ457_14G012730 [Hibiscus cannabinus]
MNYPILMRMACDVLAIPISIVASESAFSTGGRVLDSFRTSLTPRLVEALICTQDWIRTSHDTIKIEESLLALENIEEEMQDLTSEQLTIIIDETNEVANVTATPYPHRGGILYKIVYSVGWAVEDNERWEWYVNWSRRLYSYMGPFVSKSPRRAYISYRDVDTGRNGETSYEEARVWGIKYFMDNFDKLARVKTMFDPDNFFRHEQGITTLSSPSNMEL